MGNYVSNGEIIPLDIALYPIFSSLGLQLRNRIIWHFGHGLHATKRFSGRYEVVLWFTKSDAYTFKLDEVRVPQKYPQKKHFKGPNKGKLSVELIERLVLSMTNENDWVLDPFMGVGSTAIAALIHNRKAIGADLISEYVEIARGRLLKAEKGELKIRPMDRPVYDPNEPTKSVPPKVVNLKQERKVQPRLLEKKATYNKDER